MDIKEIKNNSVASLKNLLVELRQKEEDLKFKVMQNQLKNVREVRVVKKDIARVLLTLAKSKIAKAKDKNPESGKIQGKEETTK